MATYPTTGSTLTSKISTGLSTQIVVKVGADTVGAIQDIQITQQRNIQKVNELGLDGILELVPNQATTYDITVTRIVFDRLRLPEAFMRGFINIKSQTVPFDILIIDNTNGADDGAVVHTLKKCWFGRYQPSYKAGDYILTESASISCEDISTTLGTSGESAVQGGSRGISFDVNSRERESDTGNYRGSMDVADLINQVFEN